MATLLRHFTVTVLKMISNGSLVIPSHISILHVEQEVIGDETTALNSVLECDTVRTKLLAEAQSLTQKSNLTTEETERLNEVGNSISTTMQGPLNI